MNKKLGRLLDPSMSGYFVVMLVFPIAAALLGQYVLAGVSLAVTALVFTFYMVSKNYRRKQIQNYVQEIQDEMTSVAGTKVPFPVAVVRLTDDAVIYANDTFIQLTDFQDTMKERAIGQILPGFNTKWLLEGKSECPNAVTIGMRRYRVHGSVVQADDPAKTRLGLLYLSDLTQLYQVRDEYIRSRPVVSIILVDNYDELTKNLPEGAISALNARINDVITKWTEPYHGLLRRMERNRFLFIFEKRDLKRAIEDKFSLLEDVHEITNISGLSASISFGLGVEGVNFEEAYEFAALSIEMALSRGGDQAVIKNRLSFEFFGGRAKETDRRSRVRSRVTANSLMELIGQSSRVFIMGHKLADMDAVGAAMGIACMCRKKGKEAHIVLDLTNNAAEKLIDQILKVPEYKDIFIQGQQAMLLCDNRSTLIVVDTNRPDQVEDKDLLQAATRVCVVDHHRKAADYIDPVVVNFHEPYASSASEMVTELLQYAVDKKDVMPIEAKALMAGIFLDTKSFHVRTGERTFEAAAYLRQLGVDTVAVKKLLQNDHAETMEKYEIIKAAKPYREGIAVAMVTKTVPRALAAQAADELLNIEGYTASFVLFPEDDHVTVSARSIGEVNVQMVLEPLGGGGNGATAGAQIKGKFVKEVYDELLTAIDAFLNKE